MRFQLIAHSLKQKGNLTVFNAKMRVNDDYGKYKRAFIVDNFYHDPYAVREFAKEQEYVEGGLGKPFNTLFSLVPNPPAKMTNCI